MNFLEEIKNKVILDNYKVTKEDCKKLYKENLEELKNCANQIRKHFCSSKTSLCSIINGKQGGCSENCKYCAQSIYWNTGCNVLPLIKKEKALELTKKAIDNKITRLSIVTSGHSLKGKSFDLLCETFLEIKKQFPQMRLCASLGILKFSQLKKLKECGVIRYHHNLETSKNYYKEICTTHTYEDRLKTIENAQKAGLEICSGGIIGLGESIEDRIDMAFDLEKYNVESVPINILSPIKGTPLQNNKPLTKDEILKTFCIFRFIMPKTIIRCAAGRQSLGNNGKEAFESGINGMISGSLLTINGTSNEKDIKMLTELGFELD